MNVGARVEIPLLCCYREGRCRGVCENSDFSGFLVECLAKKGASFDKVYVVLYPLPAQHPDPRLFADPRIRHALPDLHFIITSRRLLNFMMQESTAKIHISI